MAGSSRRHVEARERHEHAAETHERSAAFWAGQGDDVRAQLHRDAADHERSGAALEQRWADLTEQDASVDDPGVPDDATAADSVRDEDDGRELELEMRESQTVARARAISDRESAADARDHTANERERQADRREQTADDREHLADQREGTAEAREIERRERLRHREERQQAGARREQATIDREQAASARELEGTQDGRAPDAQRVPE